MSTELLLFMIGRDLEKRTSLVFPHKTVRPICIVIVTYETGCKPVGFSEGNCLSNAFTWILFCGPNNTQGMSLEIPRRQTNPHSSSLSMKRCRKCLGFPGLFIFNVPTRQDKRAEIVQSVQRLATGWTTEEVGVRVPVRTRIFSSPPHPDRFWGPPNLLSNGYRGLFFRGVKQPGREAEHSPPASAEVKKMWIYTSTPPYSFMA
jgi:hypothetical protein